ncbi:hypothetical protein P170DRAFT_186086 [Aspergillus steynii IBT 23096]|uniref:Secreted protein n=1 Tax=Aspergillus steynii IBT 23096 TaxID=1392250 RepID=A0A2I2G9H3_9EURO|nr:uncharacterized protein P170DRAFT_186086 [Aspergillus steynii IBT 23096]PLB49525.1 hypothetical protein P170DRAFT_186086 [Aspergillus steynii IBT 23096]
MRIHSFSHPCLSLLICFFFPALPCYNSYCCYVQFYPFYSGDHIYLSFAGDEAICFLSPKEHDPSLSFHFISFLFVFPLINCTFDLYFRALHEVYWITSLR